MAIHLPRFDLTFVTIPKVACTSIKCFFYEVQKGRVFRSAAEDGNASDIHAHFPCTMISQFGPKTKNAKIRLAAVRDPLSRLISCFENKILDQNVLVTKKVNEDMRGSYNPQPSFAEFVNGLDIYQKASVIVRQHSRPQVDFLGTDLSWFRRVYAVSELDALQNDIRELTGAEASLRHHNKAGARLPSDQITSDIRAKVARIFARDYDVFGNLLRPTVTA